MNNLENGGGTRNSQHIDPFTHQPVLYHEVLEALAPVSGRDYLDGTLGAGGHAEGILISSAPHGRLLGLDLDPEALTIARKRLSPFGDRAVIQQGSFKQVPEILQALGWHQLHGILLDLGVSSMQIDRPERGFSFMEEGPLDMRFNPEEGLSAAELVNTLSEVELSQVIWEFGEERYARRIARAITAARPVSTTRQLREVIQQAVPGYEVRIHPATRTFQALRIATNRELETIVAALPGLLRCLAPGGIIAVISFHSLEDRIVKQFLRKESKDCICPPEQLICNCHHRASVKVLTSKPIRATEQEIEQNPRARSARLRIAEKIIKAQ